MRRLKCEKETIILTNEDDGFYDVYTFNQSLQKRLRAFAEKYPDDCWLKGSSEDGSETYIIKKGRLRLWEILILLYGDCTSTFMVGSTVALAGIFLTGFPPFPDVLCINKLCFI